MASFKVQFRQHGCVDICPFVRYSTATLLFIFAFADFGAKLIDNLIKSTGVCELRKKETEREKKKKEREREKRE